jgi:hypothetical protein
LFLLWGLKGRLTGGALSGTAITGSFILNEGDDQVGHGDDEFVRLLLRHLAEVALDLDRL